MMTGSAVAQSGGAAGQKPWIAVELNKLETASNACVGYFVVANGTPQPVKELRLEMFLFDKSGIVLDRLALGFADIRTSSAKIGIFNLAPVPCADVGKLLINSVLSCTNAAGSAIPDCADIITASTRSSAEFTY